MFLIKIRHELMTNGTLYYTNEMLRREFSHEDFFKKEYYPILFYYLGMTTLEDNFRIVLPNKALRVIFTDLLQHLK